MTSDRDTVAIVGSGLVGSLLASLLADQGYKVSLYERRADMRSADLSAGRSINLIATSRGLAGLDLIGLKQATIESTAPVYGRMMHSKSGELNYQAYGRDDSEHNYSVSRGDLNKTLMTEAEKRGVSIHFEHSLVDIDLEALTLSFELANGTKEVVKADRIIGADGAFSAVRNLMQEAGLVDATLTDLSHGYKEMTIPANADGSFKAEAKALHIWPRGERMLMALPNKDGSFTVTLYMPQDESGFDHFASPDQIKSLFAEEFADSMELIPDFVEEYQENPTGRLATLRCTPWHNQDKVLLIGDAAHAIVPFFGQGMNCGFEDCTVFMQLLEEQKHDWQKALPLYSESRMENGNAIADMSLENFNEMCASVGDPKFLLLKKIERHLENELPEEFRSRYSMVVYSRIPYSLAKQAGEICKGIIQQLAKGIDKAEDVDLDQARTIIQQELNPFLKQHGLSLDYKY